MNGPLGSRFSGALRQIGSVASGTAAGQTVMVAATPLLTRLYAPGDFGLFALFATFLAVAAVAATLRYDMAMPGARSASSSDCLLLLSLLLIAPTTVVAVVAYLVLRSVDPSGFGTLPAWSAALLAPALLATGGFGALRLWCVREQRFRAIGRAVFRQSVGRAAVPVALGVVTSGWVGLAIGEVLGRMLGVADLARLAADRLRAEWRRPTRRLRLRVEARRHAGFPKVMLPSSIVDALAGSLPLPIIAATHGVAAAGIFALLTRIASAPGALLGTAVADVFHAHAAEMLRQAPGETRVAFRQTLVRLTAGALAVYVPAAALAVPLFEPVFGRQWQGAGEAFVALAPLFAFALVVSPVSRLLTLTGHLHYKLVFDALVLVLPNAALLLMRDRPFVHALVAYTVASVACYATYLALIRRGLDEATHAECNAPQSRN